MFTYKRVEDVKTQLIPITTATGGGSAFMAYMFDSAKVKRPFTDIPRFTENGSAHLMPRYGVYSYPLSSIEERLKNLYEFEIIDTEITPVFATYHFELIDLLMEHVDKAITITYEEHEADDITAIAIAKAFLDGFYVENFTKRIHRYDPNDPDDYEFLVQTYMERIKHTRENAKNYRPSKDYGNRLLVLQWNEILNGDVHECIRRFSEFTGYEVDRWNPAPFIEWQQRTKQCLIDVQPLIHRIISDITDNGH